MAEESDLEKTEPASPQRLEKSREEGQVARSRELNTFALLVCGACALWLGGEFAYQKLAQIVRSSMSFDRLMATEPQQMARVLVDAMINGLLALTSVFAVTVLAAIASSVALGGFVLSAKAMAPKFGRMNPLKGLGKMVSMQSLVELGKTLGKAFLVGAVGVLIIKSHLDEMMALMHSSLTQALAQGIWIVALCCIVITSSLLVLALADVPWQIFSHHKNLRMTKDEVRREHKENEGDPHIKGKIRQQQREMSRRRMMADVPTADVIITNPTHYAVALRYEQNSTGAPQLIAKGTNIIAEKIKALAAEHKVPVLEAPPLARALHHNVEIGEQIPPELYNAVAQVLAWVYQLKNWQQGVDQIAPERPDSLPVPPDMDPLNKNTE